MLNPATIQLALALITEAPGLIEALKADIAAIQGGTMTPAQLDAQWASMTQVWSIAKAKWNAA